MEIPDVLIRLARSMPRRKENKHKTYHLFLTQCITGRSTIEGYRALARLLRDGYFSTILTSCEGSELEVALTELGLKPTEFVVGRDDEMATYLLKGQQRNGISIVKLNGPGVAEQKIRFWRTLTPKLRDALQIYLTDVVIVGCIDEEHEDIFLALDTLGKENIYYVLHRAPFHEDVIVKCLRQRGLQPDNFLVTGTYGEFDAFFIELEKQIAAATRPLERLDPLPSVEKSQLSNQPSPIKVFYMYSSSAEDKDLQKKLEAQLSVVRLQGKIIEFKNANRPGGRGFDSETRRQWEKAEVILVLVSADFLRNDYPLTREDIRRKVQTDKVLPIIVRPVADWQKDFLGTLQVLPNDKNPITRWNNIDEGLAQVAEEIHKEIELLWEKRNGGA